LDTAVTKIAVDEVRPEQHGFVLRGQGQDRVEYRVDLQFELPLDARTRAVLGELLTQATLAVSPVRAAPSTLRQRRDPAHKR
jgi:hypothetical protein